VAAGGKDKEDDMFVLDMATTSAALGKVHDNQKKPDRDI
jgi:LDH2 family malate/lactate/ureidoglycolate dehydrogenase